MAKKRQAPPVEAVPVAPIGETDLDPADAVEAASSPQVAEAAETPRSILDIPDAYQRQRLIGVWRAASRLRRINDQWNAWAGELSRGEHPDVALAGLMSEAVRACIDVLHRAGLAGDMGPAEIMRQYPRVASHLQPVPWWEDKEYASDCLKRTRRICNRDQGHLWELLVDLEADPSIAFSSERVTDAIGEGTRTDSKKRFVADVDAGTITVDGERRLVGEKLAAYLDSLLKAGGAWRTFAVIQAEQPVLAVGQQQQTRIRKSLLKHVPELNELIETHKPRGHRLLEG